MRHLAPALAIVFGLAAGDVHAESASWPQFRGSASNPVGASQDLPDRWSPGENVDWKVEIPGRGWSSPIVSGGKVFLTTVVTDGASKMPQTGTDFSNDYAAELSKQGLTDDEVLARLRARDIEQPHEVTLHYFLYCLDLETGAVLWKREFHGGRPPGGRHRKNSFVSETPVTDGTLVYVYVGNLGLFAYDLKGELAWKTPLEAFPIYLDFGTGGSPVLQGDQLVILNDNEKQQFIAAFDKRNGKLLWRTERVLKEKDGPPRQSGWTTPFVWSHKLRTEIVTIGPTAAVSYDVAGKELWRLVGPVVGRGAQPVRVRRRALRGWRPAAPALRDPRRGGGRHLAGRGPDVERLGDLVRPARRHVHPDARRLRRRAVRALRQGHPGALRRAHRGPVLQGAPRSGSRRLHFFAVGLRREGVLPERRRQGLRGGRG